MKILTEFEAKKLLSKYKIKITEGRIAGSPDEAFDIASRIGTPVAMKISSPDISHKSDVGGVLLNVKKEDVIKTYEEMITRIRKMVPAANIEGILIQQMAPPGHEIIVGLKKDAQFGYALMFGLGGIFVEVYKDVSFRVAPIEKRDALAMISEIKGYPILKGIRGRKPADIGSIADVLVYVSELAEKENIIEFDINPLIVNESGAIAVDARAMVE
ncbi:MAG: acetate--CoA ligase family protein [Candidatus Methanoperedens sp.]|nr:acetate--CoA ligase family protein [Candidatus Methanoperedens sp.]MCE8424687.1 acetate--CoA ligase family protein [Candidatus Methanoperedens sp.]MCE8427125.1 acetate--CoA ligase family protein [Candidatus Methanoperedens sp.]